MTRTGILGLLALPLCLCLAGCYSDQQKQLASCEMDATRTGSGQPLKSIQVCMDQAGYRFVGYPNTTGAPSVQCDFASVVRGMPAHDGSDVQCFEPKGWLALKIYHIEAPAKPAEPVG